MVNLVQYVAPWRRNMAAKHPHILRTTCTATALSVMLAACGGGGDSERDKAVSASPVAPTTTQNIVATAPTHACPDTAGGTGRYQAGPHADAGANSGTQDGAQHQQHGRSWGCVVGDDGTELLPDKSLRKPVI